MALKLTENFKGITAEYWKILRFDSNTAENKTVVRLALYLDEKSRKTNIKNFLKTEVFVFNNVDYTREDLYSKIKEPSIPYKDQNEEYVELNKFTESIDC